jgi:hypothetical protein
MRFPAAAVLVSMAIACSHRIRDPSEATPSRDSDLILAQELSTTKGSTVYDAVRELRPVWILRSRPNPVLPRQSAVIIYIDGQRYGAGIEGLRTIPLRAAFSVKYFDPSSAQARFGPGHLLGAIEVLTIPQ